MMERRTDPFGYLGFEQACRTEAVTFLREQATQVGKVEYFLLSLNAQMGPEELHALRTATQIIEEGYAVVQSRGFENQPSIPFKNGQLLALAVLRTYLPHHVYTNTIDRGSTQLSTIQTTFATGDKYGSIGSLQAITNLGAQSFDRIERQFQNDDSYGVLLDDWAFGIGVSEDTYRLDVHAAEAGFGFWMGVAAKEWEAYTGELDQFAAEVSGTDVDRLIEEITWRSGER